MLNYVMNHPWLLGLILPSIVAAVPGLLVKAEKAALANLFSYGDPVDQEALRSTVKVWVVWAEKKYAIAGQGRNKFEAVNALVARALPFIPAEQREDMIEQAVEQLDAAAKATVQDTPPAP